MEFINVEDQYCYDQDLICEYALIDHQPQEHDRISLYKIGWSQVKEYILFEWAPLTKKGEIQRVTFNSKTAFWRYIDFFLWNINIVGHSLPKNSPDLMYHFCYISADNQVFGASAPFQFCSEVPDMSKSIISLPNIISSCSTSMQTADSNVSIEKDKEIARLREENTLLKDTLKMIVQKNQNGDSIQNEIANLKSMVQLFQKALYSQQIEMENLKKKLEERDMLKNSEKFKRLNITDVGELETLPPFPKYLLN